MHSVGQLRISQLCVEVQICTMKAQALPTQSKWETSPPNKILVPVEFSPASDNAARKATMIETTVESIATRVALHPFLVGMKRRQLALLTSCAMAVEFQKGQVIFREGEPADRMYLIETGKITMESSRGPGDPLLAWSCLFPCHPWPFTARAIELSTAIFFDLTILREYCERDHSLGYELLKRMSLGMYLHMQATRNEMLTVASSQLQSAARGRAPSPVTADDRQYCHG